MLKFILGILISILLFDSNILLSQAPGGVKNPVIWKTTWENDRHQDFGSETFNFHPYQYFDEDRGYDESDLEDLHKVSLFMVFSSSNPSEIGELTLNNNKVVFTDSEVISRQHIAYEKKESLPSLLTYVEAFPSVSNLPDEVPTFILGSKFVNDEWYEGGVAEVVLYDRLISKEQRRQVETYLSLKYGISLADSLDYIASDGSLLWDYSNQGKFTHRLTGIGKDVSGGLDQKQSHNLYDDFSMTIAVNGLSKMNKSNPSKLNDKSFLLWSDDGAPIAFENLDDQSSEIGTIERKWKIGAIGKGWKNKKIEVIVNPEELKGFNGELPVWIVLNDNKNLNDLSSSQLLEMSRHDDNTYSTLLNLELDESETQYFTFIQAPHNFISLDVTSVECEKHGGNIDLYMHGELYDEVDYILENSNEKINGSWDSESQKISFDELPFGTYELRSAYSNTESLYSFTFSQDNCEKVLELQTDLYPNPVEQGSYFTLVLPEEREAKFYLEIHDVLGRKIKEMVFSPNSSSTYVDKLLNEGIYTVSIGTKHNSVVRTLVVINK